MGNRIVGNTYIIDTGSANTLIPWPRDAKVQTIAFWGANTSAEVILTSADTGDVVARLAINANGNVANSTSIHYGGVNFPDQLKVPVLTAGTAWIYFG